VPISITAYSQEELTATGAVGYEGLRNTPGVVLNRPANFNNFIARGISTNGYNAGLQAGSAKLRSRAGEVYSGNNELMSREPLFPPLKNTKTGGPA